MSYSQIPLPPPAINSADPIADAIADIVARTGSFTGSIRVYNDPVKSIAVGTIGQPGYVPPQGSGVWQVQVTQNYQLPGDSGDFVTFVVYFQGNSVWSNGGFLQSPVPPLSKYPNAIMSGGPMFPIPELMSGQSPGNASIIRPKMTATADALLSAPAGSYSQLLQQLYSIAVAEAGPNGSVGNMYYWIDLQFVAQQSPLITGGTGLWRAYITAWTQGSTAETVIGIGGHTIQMAGGAPPVNPPLSWNYNPQHNPTNGQNSMSTAIQLNTRFAL